MSSSSTVNRRKQLLSLASSPPPPVDVQVSKLFLTPLTLPPSSSVFSSSPSRPRKTRLQLSSASYIGSEDKTEEEEEEDKENLGSGFQAKQNDLKCNGKRGKWSKLEDEILKQAVQAFGYNWSTVAKKINGRTQAQCTKRWSQLQTVEDIQVVQIDATIRAFQDSLNEKSPFVSHPPSKKGCLPRFGRFNTEEKMEQITPKSVKTKPSSTGATNSSSNNNPKISIKPLILPRPPPPPSSSSQSQAELAPSGSKRFKSSHESSTLAELDVAGDSLTIQGCRHNRLEVYQAVALDLLKNQGSTVNKLSGWELFGRITTSLLSSANMLSSNPLAGQKKAILPRSMDDDDIEESEEAQADEVVAVADEGEEGEEKEEEGEEEEDEDTELATYFEEEYKVFLDALVDPEKDLNEEETDVEYCVHSIKKEMKEEFRNDRGALVSTDELKELMMEGQSERSNRNAQPSPSLKQPAQPSIHNPPVAKSVPGFLFSEEQMVRILQQQSQNMQILLQAFLLERELHGAKTAEGCHWWQQIDELYSHQKRGDVAYGGRNSFHFHKIPGLEVVHAIARAPPPPELNKQFVKDAKRPMRRKKLVKGHSGEVRWQLAELEPLVLSSNVQEILNDLEPLLSKELFPRIITESQKSRTTFIPSFDALLLHGLYAFGDDWESIRAHLLPNLTSKQIRIRFSNLKSRRYADNPVKDYFLLRVKPLTLEEEEVLRKSVKLYGRKFKFISHQIIKGRPAFQLKNAWKQMAFRLKSTSTLNLAAREVKPPELTSLPMLSQRPTNEEPSNAWDEQALSDLLSFLCNPEQRNEQASQWQPSSSSIIQQHEQHEQHEHEEEEEEEEEEGEEYEEEVEE